MAFAAVDVAAFLLLLDCDLLAAAATGRKCSKENKAAAWQASSAGEAGWVGRGQRRLKNEKHSKPASQDRVANFLNPNNI
jgi:hypothetical protein